MTDPLEIRILHALYLLSRDTRHISAASLASLAGSTPSAAARALVGLERNGLVDATRARLTMLGLARAVAGAAALGGSALSGQRAVAPALPAPAPLAAAPERGADADAHG